MYSVCRKSEDCQKVCKNNYEYIYIYIYIYIIIL